MALPTRYDQLAVLLPEPPQINNTSITFESFKENFQEILQSAPTKLGGLWRCGYYHRGCQQNPCNFYHCDLIRRYFKWQGKLLLDTQLDTITNLVQTTQGSPIIPLLEAVTEIIEYYYPKLCLSYHQPRNSCSKNPCKYLHDDFVRDFNKSLILELSKIQFTPPTPTFTSLTDFSQQVKDLNDSIIHEFQQYPFIQNAFCRQLGPCNQRSCHFAHLIKYQDCLSHFLMESIPLIKDQLPRLELNADDPDQFIQSMQLCIDAIQPFIKTLSPYLCCHPHYIRAAEIPCNNHHFCDFFLLLPRHLSESVVTYYEQQGILLLRDSAVNPEQDILQQIEALNLCTETITSYYQQAGLRIRGFFHKPTSCNNDSCAFIHDQSLSALESAITKRLEPIWERLRQHSLTVQSKLKSPNNQDQIIPDQLAGPNPLPFSFQPPPIPQIPEQSGWEKVAKKANDCFKDCNLSNSMPIILSFNPTDSIDPPLEVSDFYIKTNNASPSGKLFQFFANKELSIEIKNPHDDSQPILLTSSGHLHAESLQLEPGNSLRLEPDKSQTHFLVETVVMASETLPRSDKILKYLQTLPSAATPTTPTTTSILFSHLSSSSDDRFVGKFYSLLVQYKLVSDKTTDPALNPRDEITRAFISHNIIVPQSHNFQWVIPRCYPSHSTNCSQSTTQNQNHQNGSTWKEDESKLLFLLQIFKSCDVFSDDTLENYKPGFINPNQAFCPSSKTNPFELYPAPLDRIYTLLDVLTAIVWLAVDPTTPPPSVTINPASKPQITSANNKDDNNYCSYLQLKNGIVLHPSTFHPSTYLHYFEYDLPTTQIPSTTTTATTTTTSTTPVVKKQFFLVMLVDGTILLQTIPDETVEYNLTQTYPPINALGTPTRSRYFNTNSAHHKTLLDIIKKRFQYSVELRLSKFTESSRNDRVLQSGADSYYYVNPQEVINFQSLPPKHQISLPPQIGIVSFSSFSISFTDSIQNDETKRAKYECTQKEWKTIQGAIRFALLWNPDVNFQSNIAPYGFDDRFTSNEDEYTFDQFVRSFLDDSGFSEQSFLGLIQRENILGVNRLPIPMINRFIDWYNRKAFTHKNVETTSTYSGPNESSFNSIATKYKIHSKPTHRLPLSYKHFRSVALMRQIFIPNPLVLIIFQHQLFYPVIMRSIPSGQPESFT